MAVPQGASFDNLKTRKVDGIVINAQTGHPLPHVLVELDGSTHRATLTDADGHFTFADIPQAAFIALHARKPGFFNQGSNYTSVVVDPKAGSMELKLVPESSILAKSRTVMASLLKGLPYKRLKSNSRKAVVNWPRFAKFERMKTEIFAWPGCRPDVITF
jgi:hypothetical protein